MSDELIIRNKIPGDEESCAQLVFEAFNDIYMAISNGNEKKARAFLLDEMNWRGGEENMFIAEMNGKPAGIVEVFAPDYKSIPEHIYVELPMKHFGLAGGIRAFYGLSLLGRGIESFECTIAHLGVTAAARGKGIAKQLIARAEQFARKKQAKMLSLWVGSTNEIAIELYKKEGFEIRGTKTSAQTLRFFNEGTWHKMSRPIN